MVSIPLRRILIIQHVPTSKTYKKIALIRILAYTHQSRKAPTDVKKPK